MKAAVSYIGVSTDDQIEFSPDSQSENKKEITLQIDRNFER